ncbi:hypothetical protein FPZ41_34355, partial [Streptomyces sp. K1PN6]|nr:hypothetical protein [Streptomyces acidicola]
GPEGPGGPGGPGVPTGVAPSPYVAGPYSSAAYSATPDSTTPNSTSQFRAGDAADRTWGDATVQLEPVRPHDHDSRNAR